MTPTTIQGGIATDRQTARFSGLVNGVAAATQIIDSNPLLNLMTLDVGGMVLPRTFLEFRERGVDMGRETFLRESMGTISNVFLAGWMGGVSLWLYRHLAQARGAQAAPWINWQTMEHYSRLLDGALAQASSPQDARQRFIRSALQSLRSVDDALAGRLLQGASQQVPNATLREALLAQRDTIARAALSPQAVSDLAAMLAPSRTADRGVYHISAMLAQWRQLASGYTPLQQQAQAALRQRAPLSAVASQNPQAAFAVKLEETLSPKADAEWARLTRESARHTSGIAKVMADRAMVDGLSPSVHAVDAVSGKPFLKNRSLQKTLAELRTFLEQYADRALSDPFSGEIGAHPLDAQTRARIRQALFARGSVRAEAGLVTLAHRSRRWLTTLPLALTTLIAVSVAFFNNWLTQKKHHGQVFFPGEGGPTRVASAGRAPVLSPAFRTPVFTNLPMAAANDSVFDVFRSARPAGLRRTTAGGAG